MTNFENLSKYKHIYRVYESDDKQIHCEKYPVVYANSKVVYFKDVRKQEYLNHVDTVKIKTNFEDAVNTALKNPWFRRIDTYLWDVEGNLIELFNEFKHNRELVRLRETEATVISNLNKAKKEYEEWTAKLAKLKEVNHV